MVVRCAALGHLVDAGCIYWAVEIRRFTANTRRAMLPNLATVAHTCPRAAYPVITLLLPLPPPVALPHIHS